MNIPATTYRMEVNVPEPPEATLVVIEINDDEPAGNAGSQGCTGVTQLGGELARPTLEPRVLDLR